MEIPVLLRLEIRGQVATVVIGKGGIIPNTPEGCGPDHFRYKLNDQNSAVSNEATCCLTGLELVQVRLRLPSPNPVEKEDGQSTQ